MFKKKHKNDRKSANHGKEGITKLIIIIIIKWMSTSTGTDSNKFFIQVRSCVLLFNFGISLSRLHI